MRHHRPLWLAALLLATTLAAPVQAVDTVQSPDAPDLTAVRAKIKAREWKSAIAELNGMIERGVQHADVYNLMGFSLRNDGDNGRAQSFYQKALEFDPDHKSALEYQGELYLKIGDVEKARANAARLAKLCPQGCEEREDLDKTIAAAGGGAR